MPGVPPDCPPAGGVGPVDTRGSFPVGDEYVGGEVVPLSLGSLPFAAGGFVPPDGVDAGVPALAKRGGADPASASRMGGSAIAVEAGVDDSADCDCGLDEAVTAGVDPPLGDDPPLPSVGTLPPMLDP